MVDDENKLNELYELFEILKFEKSNSYYEEDNTKINLYYEKKKKYNYTFFLGYSSAFDECFYFIEDGSYIFHTFFDSTISEVIEYIKKEFNSELRQYKINKLLND